MEVSKPVVCLQAGVNNSTHHGLSLYQSASSICQVYGHSMNLPEDLSKANCNVNFVIEEELCKVWIMDLIRNNS